jgi:YVTN family beta-propeller protein
MKKPNLIFLIAILFITTRFFPQEAGSGYKLSKKLNTGGDGGWDYLIVDEPTQRLFVSHGTVTQVVDIKGGTLLSTIADTKGVHGIAIANDLSKGFISNGRDTSVTIFNLKTLELITKIKVTGVNPDAILYDEFSHKVFVYNGKTDNATVIDANTNKVVETIKLEGKPEFSVTDGKGKIYVNIEDKNSITLINALTLKVEKNWSIAPGEEPTGLALDNKNHRLFSVCGNKMMVVVNSEDGKVITTVPIGDGCDGVAFDEEKKRIFSSNGEGTLTVIKQESENKYSVLETVNTQKGARTITLDKTTHQLFLPTAEYGEAPAATKENPRPRSSIKPGSFVILVVD